ALKGPLHPRRSERPGGAVALLESGSYLRRLASRTYNGRVRRGRARVPLASVLTASVSAQVAMDLAAHSSRTPTEESRESTAAAVSPHRRHAAPAHPRRRVGPGRAAAEPAAP